MSTAGKWFVQGKVCAHCVMAGIWPCFLDVSSPNLNRTAPFTPMHNLENRLYARTHTSDYRPLREPRATPREVRASTTPTVVLQLPTVNQNRSSSSEPEAPAAAAVEHGPKELCIKTATNP